MLPLTTAEPTDMELDVSNMVWEIPEILIYIYICVKVYINHDIT